MTDEHKDDAAAASAEERQKRAPPTIDLEASEVSDDTQAVHGADAARESRPREGIVPRLLAPLSGAIAALLVLAAAWVVGLIGQPQPEHAQVSPTQLDGVAANVGDLATRLARVEAAAARPAAPAADPALAGRTEALETALAAARDELAKLSAQLHSMTSSLDEIRSMPRDSAAPGPDLAPLNERLARLEDTTRALSSELAKPPAPPADDVIIRRLAVANTLAAAVLRGAPFATALAAAKQVAADPAALAPLEPFAAKGIPSEATYLREIVPVLERIAEGRAPKPTESSAQASGGGGGVLDRLQSGLARLVRIERDAGPVAKDAPPAPAVTSVRGDDLAAARQDVARLPQVSDPQIQAWIKSVDAREAALSAVQNFSAEALAAFAKSGQ